MLKLQFIKNILFLHLNESTLTLMYYESNGIKFNECSFVFDFLSSSLKIIVLETKNI